MLCDYMVIIYKNGVMKSKFFFTFEDAEVYCKKCADNNIEYMMYSFLFSNSSWELVKFDKISKKGVFENYVGIG